MARAFSGPTVGPDTGDLLLVSTGDAAAAQRLLDRWRSRIFAVFDRSREAGEAADASAAVFEALFRSAAKYDPAMSFVERIYRLVAREVERAPAATVPAIPPSRLKESAAARAALARAAVAALPPGERSAFLLTRVAKLPVPLAATASGASEAELRRRLVRAFTFLASSLAPLVSPAAAPQPPTTGTEAAP